MMNNMQPGPHVPSAQSPYHPRRNDYQYGHAPPPMPYAYHHQAHFHGHPSQYHPQQWYPPYNPYAPQAYPSPRHYQPQPQSPLVVSSHPHAQPVMPMTRQAPHTPQPARTPQPDFSPSVASQAIVSTSTTPTTTSVDTTTPPIIQHQKPPVPAPAPAPAPVQQSPASVQSIPQPTTRMGFTPQLPWYSVSPDQFPRRAPKKKSKRKNNISSASLELPSRERPAEEADTVLAPDSAPETSVQIVETEDKHIPEAQTTESSRPTAATLPSETVSAIATHRRNPTKPVVPIVPIVPTVKSPPPKVIPSKPASLPTPAIDNISTPNDTQPAMDAEDVTAAGQPETVSAELPPAKPAAPKSWAELLRARNAGINAASNESASNGVIPNGIGASKPNSVGDVLHTYDVDNNSRVSFIEPRGLVNTGNMCYMNSVLQTLVFCTPFYDFLDRVAKRVVHSFKSDTPLIDAMILFMREFQVIDSAVSAEKLHMRLKDGELEKYGEAFIPEYVYDVIKQLPRFSSMRRGHQQDAEEFLGFLLEGLHDECADVMRKSGPPATAMDDEVVSEAGSGAGTAADGWLEVGPKQKSSVTRSAGGVTDTPITKIFGGKLRSEFRVPGLKNSVTLEPYQPLQLDIGSPAISNITDALKGLTRSETIQGDFNSPRGPSTAATKQVFIETLPTVLILHLKRFQYDNAGGTQKIWKKIGYPLELEIPKEVFPPSKRAQLTMQPGGLPKYRLSGAVYHHGKNASGGHYTADLRRQEGREWIRIDDTIIRRVRAEDVAGEGGEEDPKVLAAALESHKRQQSTGTGTNIFQAGFDQDNSEHGDDDTRGWSQVNGNSPTTSTNQKKWTGLVNNSNNNTTPAILNAAGKATPRDNNRFSVKDNKVAYILFYEKIR